MKLLSFTPERARDFTMTFVALFNDECRITPEERRPHGRLLDRFEAISVETDTTGRALRPEGADLVLEDAEHALLLKLFRAMDWRKAISREVNACEDFLTGAPEYNPPLTLSKSG